MNLFPTTTAPTQWRCANKKCEHKHASRELALQCEKAQPAEEFFCPRCKTIIETVRGKCSDPHRAWIEARALQHCNPRENGNRCSVCIQPITQPEIDESMRLHIGYRCWQHLQEWDQAGLKSLYREQYLRTFPGCQHHNPDLLYTQYFLLSSGKHVGGFTTHTRQEYEIVRKNLHNTQLAIKLLDW